MIICFFKADQKICWCKACKEQWKHFIIRLVFLQQAIIRTTSNLYSFWKLLAPSFGCLIKHLRQISRSSLLFNPISIPHSLSVFLHLSHLLFFFLFNSMILILNKCPLRCRRIVAQGFEKSSWFFWLFLLKAIMWCMSLQAECQIRLWLGRHPIEATTVQCPGWNCIRIQKYSPCAVF